MTDVISHSRQIEAPPEAVFAQIIDIEGLPSWNQKITEVVKRPEPLAEGAAWTVRVKASGAKWNSNSEALELDSTQYRFVHRSKREGKNLSYALWTWTVHPTGCCQPRSLTLVWSGSVSLGGRGW